MIMISFCNAFWPYHGGISGGIGGSSSLGVKSMIDLLVYPRGWVQHFGCMNYVVANGPSTAAKSKRGLKIVHELNSAETILMDTCGL